MDNNMDGHYRCDTCGHTGRIPRALRMNGNLPDPLHSWSPVVGRINDEFLFVQFNNSVMILDYDQAKEVVDALVELLDMENGELEHEAANDDESETNEP